MYAIDERVRGNEELPLLRHFVAHPTGYPLVGCFSAEPASVSPVDLEMAM